MPRDSLLRYFEDIEIGARVVIGRHTFTAEEIKSFAERFDPQPLHLDEAAAARSDFRALRASGWHTVVTWMRLRMEQMRREVEAQRAREEPVAQLGPSPGFRELRWLAPVHAGDTITYASEVVGSRPLSSRPGWGLVHFLNSGANQAGETVFSFVGSAFVERRLR
jgi:acyl dehydratase